MKTIQNVVLIMVLATATAGLCILVYKSGLKWGFLEWVRAVPPSVESLEMIEL